MVVVTKNMSTATATRVTEFPVRFTVAQASTPGQSQSGFGEFLVEAVSDEEAIRLANKALLNADMRFGDHYVLQQEIKLLDGWHYFNGRGTAQNARPQPGLYVKSTDTIYQFNSHLV